MPIAGPYLIEANNPAEAWLAVSSYVLANNNEARNVLVAIENPVCTDPGLHQAIEYFSHAEDLRTPKHVAYTIFPKGLARTRDTSELFAAYNRKRGFFDRIRNSWGTYFRRMTFHAGRRPPVNQLQLIIDAINSRTSCYRAAYTMIIQQPGGENIRPRGGPCLNYLAVQMEPGEPRTISLLAVYRNHDVVERVYGNYLGLGWLLHFLCDATNSRVGQLTCLSSRVYVSGKVRALRALLETLPHP